MNFDPGECICGLNHRSQALVVEAEIKMAVLAETPKSPYFFAVPFEVKKRLCEILDPENTWELLANMMSDIGASDLEVCRNAVGTKSPTEVLLSIWGSKGNTTLQLYNYLARIRMVRGMQTLRHLVDQKYHHWEELCTKSLSTASTSQMFINNDFALVPPSQVSSIQAAGAATTHFKNTTYPGSQLTDIAEGGDLIAGLQSTINAKYEEVLQATNNFAEYNVLGRGGYGVAYKGVWKNFEVAVKRLFSRRKLSVEPQKERLRQSLQELRTLSKYRHDNILPLYGISLDGSEPCLIYQFMANGSLEDRLQCKSDTPVLSWQERKNIAEGSARGLLFLHTGSDTPIIHGDIKTANILLDKHLEPKLGDFGLCRDGPLKEGIEGGELLVASSIKGTLAYLPPEFLRSKILSTKLDIYSFGVVLLEIVTGSKPYVDDRDDPHLVQHVQHVEKQCKDQDKFTESLVDQKCPGDGELRFGFFKRLVALALKCTNDEREVRPTCGEVVDALANIVNCQSFLGLVK